MNWKPLMCFDTLSSTLTSVANERSLIDPCSPVVLSKKKIKPCTSIGLSCAQ
jgi:hypothetical protein